MREMNRVKKNILVMNDNVLKQDFSMESNRLYNVSVSNISL